MPTTEPTAASPVTEGPRGWLVLTAGSVASLPLILALPQSREATIACFHRLTAPCYWAVVILLVWILADIRNRIPRDPRRWARVLAWPLVLTILLFSALGTGYRVQADEAKLQCTSLAFYEL